MNREDFPMTKENLIYFDNAATTLKPKIMLDYLKSYYYEYCSNAHRGDYDISLKTDEMYENASMHQENGAWQMIFGVNTLPAYRNHGYAADALQVMFDYARDFLGLKQLYANIAASNKASIHLFQKSGFVVTGTKLNWLKTAKGWEDEFLLQKML